MWVFIKGVPNSISGRDLCKLTTRLFKPVWSMMPIKGAKIEDRKILKIMYSNSRIWEFYELVYISPSRLAHAAIGRLNAAAHNGKRVKAHPYMRRDKSRDRRQQTIEGSEPYPGERRRYDRRRGILASQISDPNG